LIGRKASRRSRPDDLGATAVEYAVLVAGIAGVVILTITALGLKVGALFGAANAGW
jgi:Flp pilus assembly pilin Flp